MAIVYIRFAAHGLDAPRRSALLERWVARAVSSTRVTDWRAQALQLVAPQTPTLQPTAGAAANALGVSGQAAWVCFATPVHYAAGMTRVVMPNDGVLELIPAEAARLAADFNHDFGAAGANADAADGGVHMIARGAVLWCLFQLPLVVATYDPEAAAGRDLYSFQPTGVDAPRLRRLSSEIEMWLFDHEVNRARAEQGRRTVTGLWMWGGGSTAAPFPPLSAWSAGRDPFFSAFDAQPDWAADAGWPAGLKSGVVVCAERPGSDAWSAVEARWLAPALEHLRAGRIERLDLSAAARCFTVRRASTLRFWRRAHPWWLSFETSGESSDDDE